MSRLTPFACAAVALAAAGLTQPAVPEQRLTQPEFEHPRGFEFALSVAELTGDQVVVAGRFELSLLDMRTGASYAIGHNGRASGDFRSIARAIAVGGDTALLFDVGRGTLMSTVGRAWPQDLGRVPGDVEQVDTAGRAYWVGWGGAIAMAALTPASGEAAVRALLEAVGRNRRDSAAIIRFDRRSQALDTIGYRRQPQGWAYIEPPGPGPVGLLGAGAATTPVGGGSHMSPGTTELAPPPRDLVAFARDGRVAVLRQPEYRVEWILPDGRRIVGPSIPHTDVPLTDNDFYWMEHECELANHHCAMSHLVTVDRSALPALWPTARTAQFAPNGDLWLERWRHLSDSVPVFDVIDGAGVLVRRVQLPNRTRLIGFGSGTVYAVRLVADSLEYVQRYRLP